MYEFWYDYIKPSIKTMQNYATWIQTALLFILKLKISIKILQIMLNEDLIHQIMRSIDYCLQESIKSHRPSEGLTRR